MKIDVDYKPSKEEIKVRRKTKMDDELDEYDLYAVEYNGEDREPIDFAIRDENMVWAEVRGDKPSMSRKDVEVECQHPAIEFDDDEQVGECPICGATCTWHWGISADDGYETRYQTPDQWDYPDKIGGIVGRHLEALAKNDNGVI